MRTRPILGEKLWFAPRRVGWGLDPITWEGWLATAVAVATAGILNRRGLKMQAAAVALCLAALALLKGTSPGGARKLAQMKAELD